MISILLSTYNGERYLAEQIDSILAQDYQDWRLYVRDDGSSDGTKALLQGYLSCDERISILEDGENVGVKASFERLLARCSAGDYWMFADQDDVWLPNKLSTLLVVMQAAENQHVGKAVVVHSDLRLVDEKLHEIAPSFWTYANIHPETVDHNKYYLAIANSVTGCAMMFNREARDVSLPFAPYAALHDAWIPLAVLDKDGVIVPVYQPLVLYRQHAENVVGAEKYKFSLLDWKSRWKRWTLRYKEAHPLIFRNILEYAYYKCCFFIAVRKK